MAQPAAPLVMKHAEIGSGGQQARCAVLPELFDRALDRHRREKSKPAVFQKERLGNRLAKIA